MLEMVPPEGLTAQLAAPLPPPLMVKRMLLVSNVQRQASLVSVTDFPAVSRKVTAATFPVGVVLDT